MNGAAQGLRGRKAIILVGWSGIGLGGAVDGGHYTGLALGLVTGSTVFLLLIALGGLYWVGRWTREAAIGALATAIAGATVFPAGVYGVGAPLILSRTLTLATAMVVFVSWWLGPRRFTRVTYLSIFVMVGAGVAMIASSPKPPIDVWYMLQAAGRGLSHGQNIYTVKWTSGVPGEFANGFAYLPGSAVLLWPFHAVFGDVRYGLLAAMAGTGLLVTRFGRPGLGRVAACLFLLYPRALFGIEQSWVDPLLLVSICAMVVAMLHRRRGWAVVALAVCLTCKQQAWLLLPLAVLWKEFGWKRTMVSACGALAFILPWFVANPRAFYEPTVNAYHSSGQSTSNSLSLYSLLLQHGVNPGTGLTIICTAGAIAFCWWRLPKDAFGFCVGATIVQAAFYLTAKEAYFNEWELVAGLALLAVAFGRVRKASDELAGPPELAEPPSLDRQPHPPAVILAMDVAASDP
jgi:hypothetical protein